MGRVRTKTVKKSAKVIIERYYPRLTLDFETNKRICDEVAIIASKRLRNKVLIDTKSPRLKKNPHSGARAVVGETGTDNITIRSPAMLLI